MRNALRDQLMEIKKKDDNIQLIVGDIGFGVFENFEKQFPKDYLNIGICEANMIGFASGLASCNLIPVVYTIVPFLTMRAYEQIRVDIAMHKRKVILVGVGGGLAYGNLGPTHHSFEDLSLMSILPNMSVYSPSQPSDSKESLKLAIENKNPSYIRLGKNGEPDLSKFMVDKYNDISIYNNKIDQPDILVLTYGAITYECILAGELIKDRGKFSIASILQLKPIPEHLVEMCMCFKKILIVEEHSIFNSPGTHIISKLSMSGFKGEIKMIGIDDRFTDEVGSREFLLKTHGLDSKTIASKIIGLLK
tara:strand:+ start:39326 stop:40243 length:918 start_codon:yes stop_codon:yes gene_type:complete